MMERAEILTAMFELKLFGMKSAFDEIIATAVKRQHEPQRIVGDLLTAEIAEKQARSIKYQMTIAKLPLAKDIAEFDFDGTPINETLVRDLAGGEFLAHERNVVFRAAITRCGQQRKISSCLHMTNLRKPFEPDHRVELENAHVPPLNYIAAALGDIEQHLAKIAAHLETIATAGATQADRDIGWAERDQNDLA